MVAAATGLALFLGTLAALHYQQLGFTLSHYDARGHLVAISIASLDLAAGSLAWIVLAVTGSAAAGLGALERPRPFVGWILIEELSKGGDILAERARANPRWLEGFTRVSEGAGLALYRRDPHPGIRSSHGR